jgi:hypothetical protein
MMKMLQQIYSFVRKARVEQAPENAPLSNQNPVAVEMPAGSEGQTVSSTSVMMALLWQHYGLDLLHPEFSRWSEQNAPDVKYAVALNDRGNAESSGLIVGADRKIKVQISPVVDQRLRDVSSEYILWQLNSEKEQFEQVSPHVCQRESAESYGLAYAC